MLRARLNRLIAVAGVVSLGLSLVACGGGDSRDRNVEMIAGQACSTPGQTKTVSKIVNVCGANGNELVWFAAVSPKPSGPKCGKPGAFRIAKSKPQVCATLKSGRTWVVVAPQVGAMGATSSTLATAGVADDSVAPSSTDVAGTQATESTTEPTTIPSPVAAVLVPPSEVKKAAIAALPASQLLFTGLPKKFANGAGPQGPVVVQVTSDNGDPREVGKVEISITSSRPEVKVSGGVSVTDGAGRASFPDLRLVGPISPSDQVVLTATSDAYRGDMATVTLVAGVPQGIKVVAHESTGIAGVPLGEVEASVVDVAGVQADRSGVDVTVYDDTTDQTLGKVATDKSGTVKFDDLVITKAGQHHLIVQSGDLETDEFDVTVVPDSASGVRVSLPPDTEASSGLAFARQPVVVLIDRFGNSVKKSGVDVTAKIVESPDSTVKPVLSDTIESSDDNGRVTFGAMSVAGAVGSYVIEFSTGGKTFADSIRIELGVGLPASVDILSIPEMVHDGTVVSDPLMARVLDSMGNVIPDEGRKIEITSTAGITLTGAVAQTGSGGTAWFDRFVVEGTPIEKLPLDFVSSGLPPTRANVRLVSGYISELVFLAEQKYVVENVEFDVPTQVRAVDKFGNPIVDRQVSVSGRCGGMQSYAMVKTNDQGVAIFPPFRAAGLSPTFCYYFAQDSNNSGLMYTRYLVISKADGRIATVLSKPSSSAQSGVPFPEQPSVVVLDSSGAPVPAGVMVVAEVLQAPGKVVSLENTIARTDASGIAKFSNLKLTGAVGRYALQFAPQQGLPMASVPVTLGAGAPAGFAFVRQATSLGGGQGLKVGSILKVTDSAGNAVTGDFTGTMTIPGVGSVDSTTQADGTLAFADGTLHGKVGTVKPTYSLSVVGSDRPFATGTGADLAVRPGPCVTTNLKVPTSLASGSTLPSFDLLDRDGNVIDQPETISVEYGYRPADGKFGWFSNSRRLNIMNGHVEFGDTNVFHGLKGAAMSARIERYSSDGLSRVYIASSDFTISSDPTVGEVGPTGGTIVYKSTTLIDAADGISRGGHFLELAPPDWEKPARARAFAQSVPATLETSMAVGDGAANTKALINAVKDPASAAAVAADLDYFNTLDWFLPSIGEFGKVNLAGITWGQGREADVDTQTTFWSSSVVAGRQPIVRVAYRYNPISGRDWAMNIPVTGSTAANDDSVTFLRPMRAFG